MKRIKNINRSKIKERRILFLRIILREFWTINWTWSKLDTNSTRCLLTRPRSIIWFRALNSESKWPLRSLMLKVSTRHSTTPVKTVRPKRHSYRLRIVSSLVEAPTINRFKMFTIRRRTPAPKSTYSVAAKPEPPRPVNSQGMEAVLKNDIWAIKREARAAEISIGHPPHKEWKLELAKACKAKMANTICNNQIVSDRWKIGAVECQALDRNRTQAEALGKTNSNHHRPTSSREKPVTPAMQHQGAIQEVQDLSSQDSRREMASSRLINLI